MNTKRKGAVSKFGNENCDSSIFKENDAKHEKSPQKVKKGLKKSTSKEEGHRSSFFEL